MMKKPSKMPRSFTGHFLPMMVDCTTADGSYLTKTATCSSVPVNGLIKKPDRRLRISIPPWVKYCILPPMENRYLVILLRISPMHYLKFIVTGTETYRAWHFIRKPEICGTMNLVPREVMS